MRRLPPPPPIRLRRPPGATDPRRLDRRDPRAVLIATAGDSLDLGGFRTGDELAFRGTLAAEIGRRDLVEAVSIAPAETPPALAPWAVAGARAWRLWRRELVPPVFKLWGGPGEPDSLTRAGYVFRLYRVEAGLVRIAWAIGRSIDFAPRSEALLLELEDLEEAERALSALAAELRSNARRGARRLRLP